MTCASCAARIERKLNKLEGVRATVNYATEKARVSFPGSLTAEDLVKVVENTGYTAELPAPAKTDVQVGEPDPTLPLRRRLITSVVLSVPVIALDTFGVSKLHLNTVFVGSGLFGDADDVVARRFRHPDPAWLDENYFHDPAASTWWATPTPQG